MKIIIQRVKEACVSINGKEMARISKGMVLFVGVGKEDSLGDVGYCVKKCVELRMFEDNQGKMNFSCQDVEGQALVVSQFTLMGNCNKGRRPSFDAAARPQMARHLYELFIEKVKETGIVVKTGQFQAMMDVELINDGPVTFIIESQQSIVDI